MDIRIVAKALDDFGDDWHWVVLHGAERVGEGGVRRYRASSVDTICGIVLDEGEVVVTLHDTGAPSEPNCPRCLGEGVDPAVRAEIEAILEQSEALPIRR